jgi:transposase
VPDNTKVAVIKACLYEPQVNRTYAEMAAHYDTAILPARPRRPRDKAKVEAAVLIIERWLLGRLRHRRFYGLAELNAVIAELLRRLNEERPLRRLGITRRALLEELDRPHLKRLPAEPYGFAEWRLRRVGIDYHIEVDAHFYSVPHRFARREVEVRLTPQTIEIFLKGERIAPHRRGSPNHGHTTRPEHMPSSHRRYADWTIERIRRTAASTGPRSEARRQGRPRDVSCARRLALVVLFQAAQALLPPNWFFAKTILAHIMLDVGYHH